MVLFNIVVLGDGGVGKSCLIVQFVQNLFMVDYDATIENSYRKQVTVDDEASMLDILDTAGQEDYAAMRDQYIRTGQGFLLVYSITSRTSFELIKGFHERICLVKDADDYPVVILGNKADLNTQRQVTKDEAEALVAKLGGNVRFFETSAKTRTNIEEGFVELVRMLRRWREKHQPTTTNATNASPTGKGADTAGNTDSLRRKKKGVCMLL